MADIIVDTYKLSQYAQRISDVNGRIIRIDNRLDKLYWRAGLLDLWKLMQADIFTGYSWRLLRCQAYLQQTASDFECVEKTIEAEDASNFKQPTEKANEALYKVGVGVRKFAGNVVKSALVSYYSKGTVYKCVQYGKAVMKAAKGVKKISVGVGALILSSGMSSPVSLLTIVSGANDIWNAMADGAYIYNEDYDMVGKTNVLKEKLVNNGGFIGSRLGNENIGKTIGEITYYGIDLVTTLYALDESMDKIKQLSPTNFSKMRGEVNQIKYTDVSGLLTKSHETLRYEAKLAGYSYSATANFFTNAKALCGVGEKAFNVGKSVNNIITVNNFENPVIEFFDKSSDVASKVKTGAKISTGITKLIFN